MIAALAKAGRAFNKKQYADAAQKSAKFILENMRDEHSELFHRYRNGEAGIQGYLDDYAFFIWGLLELYETTFDVSYWQIALKLNETALNQFWDSKNHGFYFTAEDAEKLLVRKKEVYDGAIPSGNSVMMWNLLSLARMTGNVELENKANLIARAFSSQVTQNPNAYTMLLSAFDFAVGPSYEVVVVGNFKSDDTEGMFTALHQRYIPNKVTLFLPVQDKADLTYMAQFTENFESIDGKPTAYVCSNFQCELPTTEVEKMLSLLGAND